MQKNPQTFPYEALIACNTPELLIEVVRRLLCINHVAVDDVPEVNAHHEPVCCDDSLTRVRSVAVHEASRLLALVIVLEGRVHAQTCPLLGISPFGLAPKIDENSIRYRDTFSEYEDLGTTRLLQNPVKIRELRAVEASRCRQECHSQVLANVGAPDDVMRSSVQPNEAENPIGRRSGHQSSGNANEDRPRRHAGVHLPDLREGDTKAGTPGVEQMNLVNGEGPESIPEGLLAKKTLKVSAV
jgi:hypothetical protein